MMLMVKREQRGREAKVEGRLAGRERWKPPRLCVNWARSAWKGGKWPW